MRIPKKILDRAAEQFDADCCLEPIPAGSRQKEKDSIRIGRTPFLPERRYLTDAAYAGLVQESMERKTGRPPRVYEGMDPFFRSISGMGQIWMMADGKIHDWCRETYLAGMIRPEWSGQFPDLRKLDDRLRRHGRQIADSRLHFLPCQEGGASPPGGSGGMGFLPDGERGKGCGPAFPVRWYEEEELWEMGAPWPFRHALCGTERMPTKLAVAAVMDGETAAMAGATQDCPILWQIGVDVGRKWEGKGIGTMLVRLLAEEILHRGKIPFYATASSHIRSMNVALGAGFLPAWTEVYVKRSEYEK